MRYSDYTAERLGSEQDIGNRRFNGRQQSTSADRGKVKPSQNLRRLKVRRVKNVERDLLELQRVFVFEQQSMGKETPHRRRGRLVRSKAGQSAQASQDDRKSMSDDERHAAVHHNEDAVNVHPNSVAESNDSSTQSLPASRGQTSFSIEADEQSDVASMISCFTSLTGPHLLDPVYLYGRRYHGFHEGLYL